MLGKLSMRVFLLIILLLVPTATFAQTLDAGQKAFKVCGACHDVGEAARSKVGPPLNGLFGRKAGSVEGFAYSDALKNAGIVWDDNTFSKFMTNPRAVLPGTKMSFAGIKDESTITALTAYLKAFDTAGKFTPAAPVVSTSQDSNPNPQTLACVQSLGTAAGHEKCAGVGGEVLQAVGAIVSEHPMSGFGSFDGVGLADQDVTGDYKFFTRLKSSTVDPCVSEIMGFHQTQKAIWAEMVTGVFDFHKITKVSYLFRSPDNFPGKTVPANDPTMNTVILAGQDWVCHETVALDPASTKTGRDCDQDFVVNAYSAENRNVVVPALDIIQKACGLLK